MISPATFAFALFVTQAARALPQALPNGVSTTPASSGDPSDSWPPAHTTYYSSIPTPYSSSYSSTKTNYPPSSSTTYYSSTPNPYSSSYNPTTNKYTSSPYTTQYPSTPNPYSSSYYPTTNKYTSSPYTTQYPSTPSPYSSSYYTTTNNYPSSSYSTTYYSSTPSPYSSSSYYPSQPPYTPGPSPYPPTSTPAPYNPGASPPSPLRATYDTTFDNKAGSMDGVACSNGANGLAARFPTFGDLPSFPFIGGAFDVVWNSPNCGACWSLTNPSTGVTINITAIDTAAAGFNIAKEAFEKLTGGDISQGVVDVVANKVSPSVCRL